MTRGRRWARALTQRCVWARAVKVGIVAGALQILVNQGDHWLNRRIDGALILKTLVTPLIATTVALASAAGVYADNLAEDSPHE